MGPEIVPVVLGVLVGFSALHILDLCLQSPISLSDGNRCRHRRMPSARGVVLQRMTRKEKVAFSAPENSVPAQMVQHPMFDHFVFAFPQELYSFQSCFLPCHIWPCRRLQAAVMVSMCNILHASNASAFPLLFVLRNKAKQNSTKPNKTPPATLPAQHHFTSKMPETFMYRYKPCSKGSLQTFAPAIHVCSFGAWFHKLFGCFVNVHVKWFSLHSSLCSSSPFGLTLSFVHLYSSSHCVPVSLH